MGVELDERGRVRLACAAMGTRFECVLHGAAPSFLRAAGESALDEVILWHQRLSAFEASSAVSAINRSGGAWCGVDGEVLALLVLCRDVWERTGGAFDVALGGLMGAWGLRGRAMDAGEVEQARACAGMRFVELDTAGGRVRLLRNGVRLDMGAVGKGWALDRAADVLREAGVENVLIHGGTSSVVALGLDVAGVPWRVALDGGAWPPVVELRDAALGISAHHGRVVQGVEAVLGHVIDAAMGTPADVNSCEVMGAGVVHESAAWADALSTAVLVRPELGGRIRAIGGESASAAVRVRTSEGGDWQSFEADERWSFKSELLHV